MMFLGRERALFDIKHPMHSSGGREGFRAGLVVWIISLIVVWLTDYAVTVNTIILVLGSILGITAWYLMTKWISGISSRNKAKTEVEYRETLEQEASKRLTEARASGAFDKWESKE